MVKGISNNPIFLKKNFIQKIFDADWLYNFVFVIISVMLLSFFYFAGTHFYGRSTLILSIFYFYFQLH